MRVVPVFGRNPPTERERKTPQPTPGRCLSVKIFDWPAWIQTMSSTGHATAHTPRVVAVLLMMGGLLHMQSLEQLEGWVRRDDFGGYHPPRGLAYSGGGLARLGAPGGSQAGPASCLGFRGRFSRGGDRRGRIVRAPFRHLSGLPPSSGARHDGMVPPHCRRQYGRSATTSGPGVGTGSSGRW